MPFAHDSRHSVQELVRKHFLLKISWSENSLVCRGWTQNKKYSGRVITLNYSTFSFFWHKCPASDSLLVRDAVEMMRWPHVKFVQIRLFSFSCAALFRFGKPMVGAGTTITTRNKSSMIVRHFSNSPPGASAHAHWYCDKGGFAPRLMMYQSLFDRAVHGCTRRKSTLKDPPDCLPGVLCIPSLIVHGMTMGRCNAHLVIAIFHVFRTRLLRWPRLSLSSSGTAKRRRLLFSDACASMYLFISYLCECMFSV